MPECLQQVQTAVEADGHELWQPVFTSTGSTLSSFSLVFIKVAYKHSQVKIETERKPLYSPQVLASSSILLSNSIFKKRSDLVVRKADNILTWCFDKDQKHPHLGLSCRLSSPPPTSRVAALSTQRAGPGFRMPPA